MRRGTITQPAAPGGPPGAWLCLLPAMEAAIRPTTNLPEAEQNRRLRMGVTAFTITLVLAVVLLKLGIPPLFRTLLFLPFLVAANGVYMGLYKA